MVYRLRQVWLACLVVVFWGQVTQANAATQRLALIVANNQADLGRPKLRYAERDALLYAKVLRELGGVKSTRLLLGESADALARAIENLSQEVLLQREDVVLFFYYSGHADDDSLLMKNSRFSFQKLRQALENISARVVVAVVDSCQSGRISRDKGGTAVPAIDVRFNDQEKYQGRVFISSSAAGEASQESDEIGASFFTHYLISGLRGAADDSADGAVTMEEAYHYAYQRTIEKTSDTVRGTQHPVYDIDLKGQGQLVMTHLNSKNAVLEFEKSLEGRFQIRQEPTSLVVADVVKRPKISLRLIVDPGKYEIRQWRGSEILGTSLTLQESQQKKIVARQFSLREKIVAYAKGGSPIVDRANFGIEDQKKNIISLGYDFGKGYIVDSNFVQGGFVSYQRRVGPVFLGVGFGARYGSYYRVAESDFTYSSLKVRMLEIGGFGSLDYRRRFAKKFRWGLGLLMGPLMLEQNGSSLFKYLNGRTTAFRWRGRANVDYQIAGPFLIGISFYGGQVLYASDSGLEAPLEVGTNVSTAFEF